MKSNLETLVRQVKKESVDDQDREQQDQSTMTGSTESDELQQSLSLLIERDNPMAEAARRTLERL